MKINRNGIMAVGLALIFQLIGVSPVAAAEASLARGRALEQIGRAGDALAMYQAVLDRYRKTDSYPLALLAAAQLRAKQHEHIQAAAFPDCFNEAGAVRGVFEIACDDLHRDTPLLFERLHP